MAWESKETYRKKLLDPRWQKKRLEILEKDDWKCLECKASSKTLHVHHSYYRDDAEGPWDYESPTLMSLCENCHEIEQAEQREYKSQLMPSLARSGFTRAADIGELISAFEPYGYPFSEAEKNNLLKTLQLAMISRTMANDGGDLWRNFCGLLAPYSSYPDKKDSE